MLEIMEKWINMAKGHGFETVSPMESEMLEFMPEVRDMCSADKCHAYNKNWACPPACGTIEDCAARAATFSRGILVQTVGDVEDSFDIESMMEIAENHKERFLALAKELKECSEDVLAMGAGGCNVCAKCTYPDKPCRFPDKSIPSMEAYGLLVNQVCVRCNTPYNYGPGKMAYTSCYLIK